MQVLGFNWTDLALNNIGEFHHILEATKEYEPSGLAHGSPSRAAKELRKTCALCKMCHAKVTHSKSSFLKFMTRFNDELGYKVDSATGYVVKEQGSKKQCCEVSL
jgi:hypothetical protein